jgi:magnesium transporter
MQPVADIAVMAAPAPLMGSRDTVARHVVADVPTADLRSTVDSAIAMLRSRAYAAADAVCVIDARGRLVGGVTPDALLAADGAQTLGAVVDRTYPRVRVHDDQEHVAGAALERQVASVAVVDGEGGLLGLVPARAMLEILRQEHVEDLHRLAGIQREALRDRDALEGPPVRRARHRLPWLLFGLGGSMIAAIIVSRFEAVLSRELATAFFVPAIVYLADAIGTQTEAIAVRGLSISRLGLRHLLADELRTGVLIGATLAVLAFPIVTIAFGDVHLAIAVSAAIVGAGSVATTIGLLFPWLLQRMGFDPAFGSGPVATIIQDVASLVIYLALATAIMR